MMQHWLQFSWSALPELALARSGPVNISWRSRRPHLCRFRLDIKEAITRPAPTPMRMDATNIRADVLRNMKPTPRPISVVPPITHVLLSSFLLILICRLFPFDLNRIIRNRLFLSMPRPMRFSQPDEDSITGDIIQALYRAI